MSTRASIAGHPIHSMMIGLPIGLFVFAFFSDVAWWFTRPSVWSTIALYTLAGAIVTALLSAVPGYVDYGGLRHERSRSVARWHMALNVLAVLTGVASLWLRLATDGDPPVSAIAVSAATIALLGISGWLGATLVHVHGVSQPDAPNDHKVQTIDARPDTAPPVAADLAHRSATPARTPAGSSTGSTVAGNMGSLHPAMRTSRDDAPRGNSDTRESRGKDTPR